MPKNTNHPQIQSAQIDLLERLTEACAVSGDEGAVRKIVLDQIKAYADEITVDALGNVLAIKHGSGENRPRVMMAAHIDEVGFMLTYDDDEGLFRFDTVGGLDERQLAGKPVWVGDEHIPGVIGAKPIHLTKAKERNKVISLDLLRIDVGSDNKSKVKVGDRAAFATKFLRSGGSIRAKAIDDRIGVATLIELLKNAPLNIDLLAAFTVQEEVGLRGARVAAYALDPDVAFVLDSTPAYDLPTWDEEENVRYNTKLGKGPAIYIADRATLSDPRLIQHLKETAKSEAIPYQIRQPGGGGTDAGSIHRQRAGIPSVSVSVPARYIHTAASIARIEDWENSLALLYAALSRSSADMLANE
ncbi:MAG: M42 family metallopeptidase [Chloroflexota bacterium]|nr:M42 family metallopeptidase [Chloroflexota bacterium]